MEIFGIILINAFLFFITLSYAHTAKNMPMSHSPSCSNPNKSKFFTKNAAQNRSLFSQFTNFSQLLLDCNQTYNTSRIVDFLPRHRLVVDKSLQLGKLINVRHLFSMKFVEIINTNGFDLNYHQVFGQRHTPIRIAFLYVTMSSLDIYLDGILTRDCDSATYADRYSLLTTADMIYFRQNIYPPTICPYVFVNASTSQLIFSDITDSLLVKNRLSFVNPNGTTLYLNTTPLQILTLAMYYGRVTRILVSPPLFKGISSLVLQGSVATIETDLFQIFKRLRLFILKISNFRVLFHSNHQWMAQMNKQVKVDYNSRLEIQAKLDKTLHFQLVSLTHFMSFESVYSYPDEDLCLFKDFPHQSLVMPHLYPGRDLKCTCTLKWLHLVQLILSKDSIYMGNDYYYENGGANNLTNVFKQCMSSFQTLACDFATKFNNCHVIAMNRRHFDIEDDFDLFFLVKWLQFVLLLIAQPFLCLLSILTNLLVILVISNKKKAKLFKDKMYSYILVNAIFNILYCGTTLLRLVNTCVFFFAPHMCSQVYQSEDSQFFKIIVVFFMGNVFMIGSNVSYLSFTFYRLVGISEKKSDMFYLKLTNMNMKLYFLSVHLFGLLFSSFILFQYKLNDEHDYRKEFPHEKHDEFFCDNPGNKFQCELFNGFKLTNQIFNGILFVLLNFLIDLCLIKVFNKEMNAKMKLVTLKIDELKEKKDNLSKMVIVNGSIYICSHMPRFVTTLLLIIFARKLKTFCTQRLSCDLINEEAEFFELFFMLSNFFIFKCFNSNFNESYLDLKASLKSKCVFQKKK